MISMGFGGANMNKMMKQVQQMQAKMAKLQEELEQKTVEATAGGGVVRVVANGKNELIEIEIKPEVLDPEDPEMVQDLVLAACNEALRKAQDMVAEEMGKITGGLKLPGMPGLF
jgi:DNA-binding YbaB/EbfC family protein